MVDGRVPTSLEDALIFEKKELSLLAQRISELEKEKSQQRKASKDVRAHQSRLAFEKREKESRNASLKTKYVDLQTLKFGGPINLEALESRTVNRPAEELKVGIVRRPGTLEEGGPMCGECQRLNPVALW